MSGFGIPQFATRSRSLCTHPVMHQGAGIARHWSSSSPRANNQHSFLSLAPVQITLRSVTMGTMNLSWLWDNPDLSDMTLLFVSEGGCDLWHAAAVACFRAAFNSEA